MSLLAILALLQNRIGKPTFAIFANIAQTIKSAK